MPVAAGLAVDEGDGTGVRPTMGDDETGVADAGGGVRRATAGDDETGGATAIRSSPHGFQTRTPMTAAIARTIAAGRRESAPRSR